MDLELVSSLSSSDTFFTPDYKCFTVYTFPILMKHVVNVYYINTSKRFYSFFRALDGRTVNSLVCWPIVPGSSPSLGKTPVLLNSHSIAGTFFLRAPSFRPTLFRPRRFRQILLGQDWTKRRSILFLWGLFLCCNFSNIVLCAFHFSDPHETCSTCLLHYHLQLFIKFFPNLKIFF